MGAPPPPKNIHYFSFCGQIIARQFYKWSFKSSDKVSIFRSSYLTVLKDVTNIVCNS